MPPPRQKIIHAGHAWLASLAGVSWAFAVFLYGSLCMILMARPGDIVIAVTILVASGGMAQELHMYELAAVCREEKAV